MKVHYLPRHLLSMLFLGLSMSAHSQEIKTIKIDQTMYGKHACKNIGVDIKKACGDESLILHKVKYTEIQSHYSPKQYGTFCYYTVWGEPYNCSKEVRSQAQTYCQGVLEYKCLTADEYAKQENENEKDVRAD